MTPPCASVPKVPGAGPGRARPRRVGPRTSLPGRRARRRRHRVYHATSTPRGEAAGTRRRADRSREARARAGLVCPGSTAATGSITRPDAALCPAARPPVSASVEPAALLRGVPDRLARGLAPARRGDLVGRRMIAGRAASPTGRGGRSADVARHAADRGRAAGRRIERDGTRAVNRRRSRPIADPSPSARRAARSARSRPELRSDPTSTRAAARARSAPTARA